MSPKFSLAFSCCLTLGGMVFLSLSLFHLLLVTCLFTSLVYLLLLGVFVTHDNDVCFYVGAFCLGLLWCNIVYIHMLQIYRSTQPQHFEIRSTTVEGKGVKPS